MNDSINDNNKIVADYLRCFQEGFEEYSSIPYLDRMSHAFDYANIRAPEGASALRAYGNSTEMSTVGSAVGPVTPLELLGQQLQRELGKLVCVQKALAVHDQQLKRRELVRRVRECGRDLGVIAKELEIYFSKWSERR